MNTATPIVKTAKWPANITNVKTKQGFIPREIKKEPTTPRGRKIKQRLLDAKVMLDPQFSILYTKAWQENAGHPLLIRRALSYAHALTGIQPVINEDELLVVQKTRYMRGAPTYLMYSQKFYPVMIEKAGHSEEDELYAIGTGGGREGHAAHLLQLGIFGMREEDAEPLIEACKYWDGKCIEDAADPFMKDNMPEYEDLVKGFATTIYPPSVISIMEGRWVPAHDMIILEGCDALIAKCEEKIRASQPTSKEEADKIMFWRASIVALKAQIQFAKNYADEARRQAKACTDETRKAELIQIAETLEHIPAKPARTFREALQAAWLNHVCIAMDGPIVGLSLGRLGQLLYPFYKEDLAKKRLTREQALELLELARVKFSSEEYVSPRSWEALASGNLFQHWVVGGVDPKTGLCAYNEVEELVLEAGITMQTIQPTLGVIYAPNSSEKMLIKAAEVTKGGTGYPAWFNYNRCQEHLLAKHQEEGVTLEDARDVAMFGCVEVGIPGKSHGICHPAFFNEVKVLEIVLHDGVDPRTNIRVCEPFGEFKTFEDLFQAWAKTESWFMRVYMRYWLYVVAVHREINPLVIGSVYIKDCLDTGKPLDWGGARYNKSITLLNSGMVNVSNSLVALKKLVFEDKKYTMAQVLEGIKNNFGYGHGPSDGKYSMLEQTLVSDKWVDMHNALLAAPKFGNDDDYADEIFVRCWQNYKDTCYSETTYQGYPWIPAGLSISAHGPFGRVSGALPDGKLAGVTLTDGIISATPGTDVSGPIALFRSGVKLDCGDMTSVQLNMKLHPNAIKGDNGTRHLLDLIKGFFEMGGFHIQFNVVDSEMLIDAQKRPQEYRDLIVRVAGFSATWVELGKPIQDELIARTEYCSVKAGCC